ncbi:MAG: DUF4249 family protein [Bacteroidales bacterium]|nr:DUF4249 family protein [Bacteroidales bacterium]
MKLRNILLFGILVLASTSCQKILRDFDFQDKDPLIVIQARFTADSTSLILVSRSLDMYDRREVKTISKAFVFLTNDEGDRISLTMDSAGWYSVAPEYLPASSSYTLEVEAEGFPTARSSFYIPPKPEVISIDTTKIKEINGPYAGTATYGKLIIHLKDDPGTEDFYVIRLKKRTGHFLWSEKEYPDTAYRYSDVWISSESPYVDLTYDMYNGYMTMEQGVDIQAQRLIVSDRLFNGEPEVTIDVLFSPLMDDLSYEAGVGADSIDVFIASIDEHFYEYARVKAEIISAEGNPLAEPVTPYSTVEDGYGLVYGENQIGYTVDLTGLFTTSDYYSGVYY